MTINVLDSFGYQDKVQGVIQEAQSEYNQVPETDRSAFEDRYLQSLRDCYQDIMTQFNAYLKENNFVLNAPKGNELNISSDGLLLQSSTKANMVMGHFSDGEYEVPGSYVEFAYRGILEAVSLSLLRGERDISSLSDQDLRDGFEVGNADKIFESTYMAKEKGEVTQEFTSHFADSCQRLLAFIDHHGE